VVISAAFFSLSGLVNQATNGSARRLRTIRRGAAPSERPTRPRFVSNMAEATLISVRERRAAKGSAFVGDLAVKPGAGVCRDRAANYSRRA